MWPLLAGQPGQEAPEEEDDDVRPRLDPRAGGRVDGLDPLVDTSLRPGGPCHRGRARGEGQR